MARETQFPRRIIKTVEWIRHASDIDPDGRFLAENLEGFLFIVVRTPQEFPRVRIRRGSELYYARIDLEPPVRVWFTFDDRSVTLLDIEWDYPSAGSSSYPAKG